MSLILFLLAGVCFAIIIWAWLIYKKKPLSPSQKQAFLTEVDKISQKPVFEQILAYDIVLHRLLKTQWYSGSLGEILKKPLPYSKEVINELWRLHKARNTFAHEIDAFKSETLKSMNHDFQKILKILLR